MKIGPVVEKVPEEAGMIFFLAIEPATARTETIVTNRPSNIAIPVVILKKSVLILRPLKALPLLLAVEIKA